MPKKIIKTKPVEKKVKAPARAKKAKYTYAVGRRKTAKARVRLYRGKGETVVNGKPIGEYFVGEVAKIAYLKPFTAIESEGKFYATIKVEGSGNRSQLEAAVLGLARALDKENNSLYHSALSKNKLLTRDPRARERRKPGQMGRARKKKQSPKR